jgi:hypothetical protein
VSNVALTACIVESPGGPRCLVAIFLQDGVLTFTLDVSNRAFGRLPTITADERVGLLHTYLASAPFVPLDWMHDREV